MQKLVDNARTPVLELMSAIRHALRNYTSIALFPAWLSAISKQ